MLVTREYPVVGDRVSGECLTDDFYGIVEGTVTAVHRTKNGISDVDITLDSGETSFVLWTKKAEILEHAEPSQVENGYCPICHSYCWGDCEANGLTRKPERLVFAPFHKGDTGTVYEV